MKPLYAQEEFDNSKNMDFLPVQCYVCNLPFLKRKREIKSALIGRSGHNGKYCSKECKHKDMKTGQFYNCVYCGISVWRTPSDGPKNKTPNIFCSSSCAATYNNTHKTHGYRRSKLEIYLEEHLSILYPKLNIHYNRKDTINSELDIYIPSLNLAVELNGIFHYEPIFGINKLNQVKNNDNNKFMLCQQHKIDLCIIDTSKQKKFSPSSSQQYLDIITKIVDERLLLSQGMKNQTSLS